MFLFAPNLPHGVASNKGDMIPYIFLFEFKVKHIWLYGPLIESVEFFRAL